MDVLLIFGYGDVCVDWSLVWCVVGSVVFNKCGGGGQWVRVILGPDPHIPL